MKLELKTVPKLVGSEAKEKFEELNSLMESTKWPLYLVGPSGSGKSIMAMNLAKKYSMQHDVPAYYVQLSQDLTKTSLILGLRLVKGSLVPVKGMVAEAMVNGGVVVVDEATHATQELLLMFNGICDRTAITSIGDEIVVAQDSFRLIFCGNDSSYAGNVKLPQSFAQRLISFNFGYPCLEDEAKIAHRIFKNEFAGDTTVTIEASRYVASLVREFRRPEFPLSVRNVASAMIMMEVKLAAKKDASKDYDELLDKIGGNNPEAIVRRMFSRAVGREPKDANDILGNIEFTTFLEMVAQISAEGFKSAILSATMFHLDVDGFSHDIKDIKQQLASSIF